MTEKLDIEAIRSQFPLLAREVYGRPLVYLDNTATSQTPRRVVEAITAMYYNTKANVHRGVFSVSQEATAMMEQARADVARFINAPSTAEVIFTRGTTESINLVASSLGSMLSDGDEIIVTTMEHHANIVPWQLLQSRRRVKLRAVPLTDDGRLDMEAFKAMLNPRVKLVSVAHVSNVLGTVNPVKEIARLAHQAGALVMIDGAQAVSHLKVDVADLDTDFYAFSAHKMYGPTGVGVLYGRRSLLEEMPPYQGGGEMIGNVTLEHTTWAELPFKFEAGTPNFVDIAATSQAISFVESLGIDNIAAHERDLLTYTTARMAGIPGVRIFGSAPGKAAIISFVVGGEHPYDVGLLLDKMGVAVRTGHHCAQPLMRALGVEGTLRASFAVYNTRAEADAFIAALARAAAMLG